MPGTRRRSQKKNTTASANEKAIKRVGVIERIERGENLTLVESPAGLGKSVLAKQISTHLEESLLLTPKSWEKRKKPPSATETVIIDDVHLLKGASLTGLLRWLRGRDTESKTILFTRTPVPPKLETALTKLTHHRIGTDRLAFERDESWEWIQDQFAEPVPEDIVEGAHDISGGWPLLLRMIMPKNGEAESLRGVLRAPQPPDSVVQFIEKEIWNSLSKAQQQQIGTCAVFRRIDEGRVHSVLGSKERASETIHFLESTGLVIQRNEENRFASPLLRESLALLLQRLDPTGFKAAHGKAANYLIETAPDEQAPDIVGHLLDAGMNRAALQHLDQHADHLAEQVSAERILEWLSALKDCEGDLPLRSTALHARVTAAQGDWKGARAHLKRCEQLLKSPDFAPAEERPLGYSRIASVRAHISWLRGRSTEANAYCQRALTALRQAQRQSKKPDADALNAVRMDLLSLQARLFLEAGRHNPARDVLKTIVKEADALKRTRAQANALNDLGTLLLREGDALGAIRYYKKATPLTDRVSNPDLHGLIRANLARCHIMLGRLDDAHAYLADAMSARRTMGPGGMAYTLLLAARYHEASENITQALTQYRQAMVFADRGGNMKLRAETLTRWATCLAREGQESQSKELLGRVQTFIGDLRRAEPALAAQMYVAKAAIASSERRFHEASMLLGMARDRFVKLGYQYDECHCYLLLAEVEMLRSSARKKSTELHVRRHVENACKISNERRYDFGQAKRFNPILQIAVTLGGVEAGQHLMRLNGPMSPLSVEVTPSAASSPDAHFRLLSPDGERLISREEADRIVSAINPEHLNVIQLDGSCIIRHRGNTQTGDLKRVILPLMRTLMRSSGEDVRAPALAEAIWGEGPYDQRARTRLKVAISRLRSLLGHDAKHLRTIPGKGPHRSANTCYRLETALPFVWIEDIQRR